jgi:hypothetical protein
MKYWTKLSLILMASTWISCGKKDENTSPASEPTTTYPLYVGAIAIDDRSTNTTGLQLADSGFRNRSIASGSPDEYHITVLSMHLSNGIGSTSVPIFLDDAGKVLKVQSGYVDLTDLFQEIKCLTEAGEVIELEEGQSCECGLNANREPIQKVTVDPATGEDYGEARCPSVQPTDTPGVAAAQIDQKGSYTFVNMRIKTKAQMKGCVTGNFMYTVASAADDQVHTFCTQAGKSLYDSGKDNFVNSDFESVNDSKSAELMDIALDVSGNFASQQTMDLTFPISGGIEIDGEKAPQITLGIDLGRALRFSGLFTDHPREPQGNMQSTGSHFFPLEPKTNMFTFVGKPGSIIGHSYSARVGIVDTEAEVPANKTCAANSSDCHIVAGWMTTIFASDGSPLVSNLMPDDDNAMTVLKGSNFSATGYDLEVFKKLSDKVYDVSYVLGQEGTKRLEGKVSAIDFGKEIGESQTTSFSTSSMTNGKFSFGQVLFNREL